jgi:small subunit ribosomal protein S9
MNGKGKMEINGKDAHEYFADSKNLLNELMKPFSVLELEQNKFDISAKVSGGGHAGQADAIRLGIAKALAIMNEDLKGTLRRAELLGRDPREKERKKFGLKGARKKRQFTKR